jgi:hypothetical protein
MEIKNIVVCGDSFCSAEFFRPNSHFSELLAIDHGYIVKNLARGGISNVGICYQIKTAIELNADLILYNTTDSSRLDIPLNPFIPAIGLKNFIYPYESDVSSTLPYVGDITANIYSDNVHSLLENRPDLPKQLIKQIAKKKEAIKYYLAELQDSNLKLETEMWMFGYWQSVMDSAGIKFLQVDKTTSWDYINRYIAENPDKLSQCVYHTDESTQQLVANSLKKYIDRLIG